MSAFVGYNSHGLSSILELLKKPKAQFGNPILKTLGLHSSENKDITVHDGKYGPYVQRGQLSEETPKPKRSSLPKDVKPEDLTFEIALGLLQLPRLLGDHPDVGTVQAGLGRFGPYVVWNKGKGEKDYRSIKGDDDVLKIDLDRALELLAMNK